MIGAFENFPYTDLHRLNLDWLLKTVKKHEELYEKLVVLPQFAEELARLWVEIQRVSYESTAYTDMKVGDAIINMRQYTNMAVENVRLELMQYMMTAISDFSSRLVELNNLFDYRFDWLRNWLDLQLEIIKNELINIPMPAVFNPLTGTYQSIEKVFASFFEYMRYSAITARDFDILGLDAATLDGLNLTAFEYDLYGRVELWDRFKHDDLMFSPFDGMKDTYANLIWKLAALHQNNLTAEEFDSMDWTVGAFESINQTAYEWDWLGFGVRLGLTAGEYDATTYTAQGYDNLSATAYTYDWVGIPAA